MPLIPGKDLCPWCGSVLLVSFDSVGQESEACISCKKPLWWLEWYARAKGENREAEAYPDKMKAEKSLKPKAMKSAREKAEEMILASRDYGLSYAIDLVSASILLDRSEMRREVVATLRSRFDIAMNDLLTAKLIKWQGAGWEGALSGAGIANRRDDIFDAIAEGGEG